MKINVDSYLNHEWEQHCKQQEEEMEMEMNQERNFVEIGTKNISVVMTADELGTVIESVMGYVAWLENTLKEIKDNDIRNKDGFLTDELARCRTAYEKLDKAWWDGTGAEEYL